MKSVTVFNVRRIIEEMPNKAQINSVDYLNDALFIGDKKGFVYGFLLVKNEKGELQRSPNYNQVPIGKSKVDLKGVPEFGHLITICDGVAKFFRVASGKLVQEDTIMPKLAYMMALNSGQPGQLLISKDKGLVIFKFNGEKYLQTKEINFAEKPSCLEWSNNIILAGVQHRDYLIVNTETNRIITLDQIKIPNKPTALINKFNEILVFDQHNLGHFFGTDGKPSKESKGTIVAPQNKTMQSAFFYNGLYIILLEGLLHVYIYPENKSSQSTSNNSMLLQERPLEKPENSLSFFSTNSERVFVASSNMVCLLQEARRADQILEAQFQYKINEARALLNLQIMETPEEQRKAQMDLFDLDCAWVMTKYLNFEGALKHFTLCDSIMDPREVIALFPDLLPLKRKTIEIKAGQANTMSMVISQGLNPSNPNFKSLKGDDNSFKTESKNFLKRLLESKLRYFKENYNSKYNSSLSFVSSELSLRSKKNIFETTTVEALIETIEFVLVRLYVDLNKREELKKFCNEIECCKEDLAIELEPYVEEFRDKDPSVLAKFYSRFGKVKEALEIWKSIGTSKKTQNTDEACSETVKILVKVEERKIVFSYLSWVLETNREESFIFFNQCRTEVVSPDMMLEYFKELKNPELISTLKEKYLETLTKDKNSDSRYHTELLTHYVEKLFAICGPKADIGQFSRDSGLQEYRKKLNNFLESPNAKYIPSTILTKIQGSWLLEEEVLLHFKQKDYKRGIGILVKNNKLDFAEKQCANGEDFLLTTLFMKYIRMYKKASQGKPGDPKTINTALRDSMKQRIGRLLQMYASHPQLDPIKVIEEMPEEWLLNNADNCIGSYLNYCMSHWIHMRRKTKVRRYLSEVALLRAMDKLSQAEKARVRITEARQCSKCKRKIANWFAVYPNGVVVCYNCCNNMEPTICPVTKQDFEKNFKY